MVEVHCSVPSWSSSQSLGHWTLRRRGDRPHQGLGHCHRCTVGRRRPGSQPKSSCSYKPCVWNFTKDSLTSDAQIASLSLAFIQSGLSMLGVFSSGQQDSDFLCKPRMEECTT